MLQQRATRLRRRHALPSARQQRGAERLFHLADSRTRCGERKMRAFRAMRNAARLHDMAKQTQINQVEPYRHIPYPSPFTKADSVKCSWNEALLRIILRPTRSKGPRQVYVGQTPGVIASPREFRY